MLTSPSPVFALPTYSSITLLPGTGMRLGASMSLGIFLFVSQGFDGRDSRRVPSRIERSDQADRHGPGGDPQAVDPAGIERNIGESVHLLIEFQPAVFVGEVADRVAERQANRRSGGS